MADMYGAVCSNTFKVKDVTAFREWFKKYSFGDEVEIVTDETTGEVSFAGTSFYPSASPQTEDEDGDWGDADLMTFAAELCQHLENDEYFNIVAGGHEKLRYTSFSQLIIFQQHPDTPYFRCHSSDMDKEEARCLVQCCDTPS